MASTMAAEDDLLMAAKKVVFIAFAIEHVRMRDLLKGESLHTKSPFEYVDMSVKEAYDERWKKRVRTRILRSDGVIAIVSKNSLTLCGPGITSSPFITCGDERAIGAPISDIAHNTAL